MPTPPLIGRELDLAVALEQLKRIEHGVPASLMVRGEAGIGKSRLVAEVVNRASRLGHFTLLGQADDLDAGIPYAVFRDMLARQPPELAGALADLRAALAGQHKGEAPPEDHVSAVFASAVSAFRRLAAQGPTVLVVEDLHLADRESIAVVGLLARLGDVPADGI